jgi:hypothetical protein
MTKRARFKEADGVAALGICESLLIALTELKVISEQNARDWLTDLATPSTARPPMRRQRQLCSPSSRGKHGVRALA